MHYISRFRDSDHIIISIDAEKALNNKPRERNVYKYKREKVQLSLFVDNKILYLKWVTTLRKVKTKPIEWEWNIFRQGIKPRIYKVLNTIIQIIYE